MIKTYEIVENGLAIKCLICGLTSYNSNDVKHIFCGHCKRFHLDEMEMSRVHEIYFKEPIHITKDSKLKVAFKTENGRIVSWKATKINRLDWTYDFFTILAGLLVSVVIGALIYMHETNTGIVKAVGINKAVAYCIIAAVVGIMIGLALSYTYFKHKENGNYQQRGEA